MDRRTQILRRAAEIFARKGVAETSMEDIAAAVGIKREGVYYYFENRTAILLEIILPQSNALLSTLRRICGSSAQPAEKLRSAIGNHLDAYNPNYVEMSVALREHHFVQDQDKLHKLRAVWEDYEQLWRGLIAEGQNTGAFDTRHDAKLVAFGILGMCNWVCRWYRPGGDIAIDDIADTYADMVMGGLIRGEDPQAIAPGT
jgi:AcrR family transcriptional regulator